MDQRIGIEFQVMGHDKVSRAIRSLYDDIDKLQARLKGVTQKLSFFDRLGNGKRVIAEAATATSKLNTELSVTATRANAAAAAMTRLARAAHQYASALPRMGANIPTASAFPTQKASMATGGGIPMPMPVSMPAASKTPSGKRAAAQTPGDVAVSPWGMGAPGFMLRYMAVSKALQGASYATTDIALGRSRQELAQGLGGLTAVGFSREQRKQAEIAAQAFQTQFWTTTKEEYIQALGETASQYSVERIGFKNLQHLNEAASQMGALSQMTAEQAAGMQSAMLKVYLANMPKDMSEALLKGENVLIKDFGVEKMMGIGEIGERLSSQIAKTIEISSNWGADIMNASQYSLQILKQKGWDSGAILALQSLGKDLGIKSAKWGRGLKDLFVSGPEDISRMLLMMRGQWIDPLDAEKHGMKKSEANDQNKRQLKALEPEVRKMMSTPEGFMNLLKKYQADFKGMDASKWQYIADAGFSKNFINQIQALWNPAAIAMLEDYIARIRAANPNEMYGRAQETLNDAGTAWQRLSNAASGFAQTLADSSIAHGIAGTTGGVLNWLTAFGQISRQSNKHGWGEKQTKKFIDENMMDSLVKNHGEAWAGYLRTIVSATAGLNRGIQTVVDTMGETLANLGESMVAGMTKARARLAQMGETFANFGNNVVEGITSVRAKTNTAISEAIAALTDLKSWVASIFSQVGGKLAAAFKELKNAPQNLIKQGGQMALDWFGLGNKKEAAVRDPLAGKRSVPGGRRAPSPTLQNGAFGVLQSYEGNNYGIDSPFRLTSFEGGPAPSGAAGEGGAPQVRVFIGQHELKDIIAEIISQNRAASYQGFGGDPIGYNPAV